MTATATKPRLGFNTCAGCGGEVHYRAAVCKQCQTPNTKVATVSQTAAGTADDVFGPMLPKPATVVALPTAAVVVEPYVVLQDFKCLLGDVTGVFKAKMVLTDYAQIQKVLENGGPIVPVSKSTGLTCCPACQHVFPLMGNAPGPKRAG